MKRKIWEMFLPIFFMMLFAVLIAIPSVSAWAEEDAKTKEITFGGFRYQKGEEHWHWIYNDEVNKDIVVSIDDENLTYTYQLSIAQYDETTDSLNPGSSFYNGSISAKDRSISLDGATIASHIQEDAKIVAVEVEGKDGANQLVASGIMYFDVREPKIEPNYPMESKAYLPEDNFGLGKFNCYLEDKKHPYGEDVDAIITAIEATDDLFEVDGSEEENWNIHIKKAYGGGNITISYRIPASEEPDKVHTKTFEVSVMPEVFEIGHSYPHDCDTMLTNSKMEIAINLDHGWYNLNADGEEGNRGWENVEDYELSIKEYDRDYLEDVSLGKGGKSIIVKSKDKGYEGEISIELKARLRLEDEKIQTITKKVFVRVVDGGYTYIDIENWNPQLLAGDSLEFTPQVMKVTADSQEGACVSSDIRYRVNYDENCIEVKDKNGKIVKDDSYSNSYPYILTRKDREGIVVEFIAEQSKGGNEWEEISRREFRLDNLYDLWYDIQLEGLRDGDYYTWVFSDEQDYTITASSSEAMENHPDNDLTWTWTWTVKAYNNKEEADHQYKENNPHDNKSSHPVRVAFMVF